MAGAWALALDGGGTKTAAALASREGEVLILPEGAGCNPQDGPGWDGVLADLLGRASRRGGGLAAAALGIPGRGEVPAHDRAVDALLARLLPCPLEAMNDVALAHWGAFGGGEGVLVLSGTGSMAWARGPLGEARVGGWGDVIGDEGSAYWIGREGLAMTAHDLDGLTSHGSVEARALCRLLGPSAEGKFAPLTWLMAQPDRRAAVAGVARHVDALAEKEFSGARSILGKAARKLARQAKHAAHRTGLPLPSPPWVGVGGTFRSRWFRACMVDHMRGAPTASRLTTLGGGLFRAATLAGWDPDEAWAVKVDARLRAGAPALDP